MPVTRSGSKQDINLSHDVIVLSSDDDEPIPKKPLPKRTGRQRAKAKARTPFVVPEDVVEISSEDDRHVPRPGSSTISTLQNQARKANAEADQATTDLKALLSSLEDQISCEICTMTMWTPYNLPCGHTFCGTCLESWFSTILAQYLTAHPGYRIDPVPEHYTRVLQSPRLPEQERHKIQIAISALRAQHPRPPYTCPTCRSPVTSKPAEVFALKQVVRSVAARRGETSPTKVGHGRNRPNEGLWDGFFPS